jgi:phage tail sheath protein FI
LAPSTGEEGLMVPGTGIYTGIYYPWGLSTNTDGSEIMIPASAIALRTMAYNDQVSYPWFAPAGFQRGLVSNATSVGYLTDEGEYKPVLLNPGQRDTLYVNKINPIAFIPGRGLVVYGQKTLYANQSALDRVNVARLANYLKYNLDNLMKPFLFEQNDQQTRDSAKLTVERFLTGLVTLRALEDFAVLCDESNNTPERRDMNQLWVDVLIKPIKAIEFIYIPVRIRNSGDELTLAGG